MTHSVYIIATGARTPVGLQSASAAAAVRAGISGISEHPFIIDQAGDPMSGAVDALIDPEMVGPKRMLALAETALREACLPLTGDERAPRPSLPVFLALPEFRPGFTEQDAQRVRSGLAGFEGLPIEISEVNIFTEGHAAGLLALETATRKIQQGAFEICMVGGVDSYFQLETIKWLDENRQLAGAVSRSGFVPGEGAGFCLLMAESARKQLRAGALARMLSVVTAKETKLIKTSDICLGEGLTTTVRNVVSGLSPPAETINKIICDVNGERYRGEEWGFVCLRLPQYFDDPTAYLSPADCWGDMGAASGTLFTMLACQASVRGYTKGPRTLLWTSSERGLRGAAVLELENLKKNVGRGDSHV